MQRVCFNTLHTTPHPPPLQQGHEQIQPGQAAAAAGEKGVTRVSRETPVAGGAPPLPRIPQTDASGKSRQLSFSHCSPVGSHLQHLFGGPKPGPGPLPCTPRKGGHCGGGWTSGCPGEASSPGPLPLVPCQVTLSPALGISFPIGIWPASQAVGAQDATVLGKPLFSEHVLCARSSIPYLPGTLSLA